ncbi:MULTISPECIES: hypothetical protein [unclassified Butyrivibrio]|uniref:hypothetical protein n=1 Tax=unclassified Butyrivibrio TaxID=2639466 RepID=UPI00040BFB26|nr:MULTISPECIES: hypothetical protein [unclassified Butyrivibrio]
MKTVFIDCSPKKRLSASGFVAAMTGLFVFGSKKMMKLRTKADYDNILKELEDADAVVFTMPLYVDGVPSHVLPFLKKMETWCKNLNPEINVYVIANNGFIEGRQNEPLMQIMENFCIRCGIKWCGGLGIGGGVMMNVMRIMIVVIFALAILNLLLTGIRTGNFLDNGILTNLLKDVAEALFFGCGIITFDIWIATCINRRKEYGKHYTRIMLPSFLFILGADMFFTVVSIIKGGIFRGWFSKKKPDEGGYKEYEKVV